MSTSAIPHTFSHLTQALHCSLNDPYMFLLLRNHWCDFSLNQTHLCSFKSCISFPRPCPKSSNKFVSYHSSLKILYFFQLCRLIGFCVDYFLIYEDSLSFSFLICKMEIIRLTLEGSCENGKTLYRCINIVSFMPMLFLS